MKRFFDFMNESRKEEIQHEEETISQISESFGIDIEDKTVENEFFREVLYTGKHLQLVIMCIPVGEDIGKEVHNEGDQFIRVESGTAEFMINDVVYKGSDGFAVVIDQGSLHNVRNIGEDPLKLYAVYSWPNHPKDRLDIVKPTEE